jgi:ADP-ribose pyrophosphatase YjhB (NUDIX family)
VSLPEAPRLFDREYPRRPVVGVGAVVVVRTADRERLGAGERASGEQGERDRGAGGLGGGDSIVLVRRRFEPLAGRWSLPGGAVEAGETLAAAVAREVVEETGLVVDVGPVVEVFDRIMRDDAGRVQYHFVLIDYLCLATGGRLAAGSDVSDALVVHPPAPAAYDLTPETHAVIAQALAHHRRPPVSPDPEP